MWPIGPAPEEDLVSHSSGSPTAQGLLSGLCGSFWASRWEFPSRVRTVNLRHWYWLRVRGIGCHSITQTDNEEGSNCRKQCCDCPWFSYRGFYGRQGICCAFVFQVWCLMVFQIILSRSLHLCLLSLFISSKDRHRLVVRLWVLTYLTNQLIVLTAAIARIKASPCFKLLFSFVFDRPILKVFQLFLFRLG